MNTRMRRLGIVSAVLAFLFCLAGGVWILINVGFDSDDALGTGIGLYFVGKALFVGPMLLIASLQAGKQ